MEKNEISTHELAVCAALRREPFRWLSNNQIASEAKISERTVRAHTRRLVELGLLDLAEVFPAHRYRWSTKAEKRNAAYLNRLDKAREVFAEL
jgi:DNA-binding Lrp family transcriptional regulator